MSNGARTGGGRISARNLAIGGVALLAGAGLVALAWYATSTSGDEPPITVKHGTIELNLVSTKNNHKWDKQNGKSYWEIKDKGGNGNSFYHNSNQYTLVVGYNFIPIPNPDPTKFIGCAKGSYGVGSVVTFKYAYTTPGKAAVTAMFDVSTRQTRMTPSSDFALDTSTRTLSFGKDQSGTNDGGYIAEIDVDGNVWCAFEPSHPLELAVLLDSN